MGKSLRWVAGLSIALAAAFLPIGLAQGSGPDVDLTGTFRIRHGDVFGTSPREVGETRLLDTGGGHMVELKLGGKEPEPGARVRIAGSYDGKTLVAAGATSSSTTT